MEDFQDFISYPPPITMDTTYSPTHIKSECRGKCVQFILGGDVIFTHEMIQQIDEAGKTLNNFGILYFLRNRFLETAFSLINFEGVIANGGELIPKTLPPQFSFRAPPQIVIFLKRLGKCIVTCANNHIMDYGRAALEEMLTILKKNRIPYVGVGHNHPEALHPFFFVHQNINFAFLAFTDLLRDNLYADTNQSGPALLSPENIKTAIDDAKTRAHFIIVALHTVSKLGTPFSFFPDDHQKLMSRFAIDCGADVVVGHQPHGVQQVELYSNRLIFYSLGALLYDPGISHWLSKAHPFFGGVQMHGGAIVTMHLCAHGKYDFSLLPTKVVRFNQKYFLVIDIKRKILDLLRNVASHLFGG